MKRLRDHLIERALAAAAGNVREAARLLQADRRVVQRWKAEQEARTR